MRNLSLTKKHIDYMKKIFSILFLAALVMVACEDGSTEDVKPTITITSGDVLEVGAEGGEVEILYTVANGESTKVNVSENATWIDAKQEGDAIKLTIKANDTSAEREAVVTLKYYASSAKVTVKQAGSEYDVVFAAKRFEGIYFGKEYSDTHNYYVILSDIGTNADATAKANGTYYYFDLYSNVVADDARPILPDGEYTFDATNSYADKTFSDESSWYAVMGADGKVAKAASFKDATISVKNGKFTATIVMEDDTTHLVTFEGEFLVATGYIHSTFTEDVEFAVEGANISATNYGDTLEVGQQNWFIEAVKGNDYFCFEVFTSNAESCDGIYQVLPSDSKDYINKFIPGLIGEEGLIGSWYAKLTNNTIKGDVMAPMSSGMIRITTEGNAMTIELGCKDDAGNNITGSVKGNLK